MKRSVKIWAGILLLCAALFIAFPPFLRDVHVVPVVMYHSIDEKAGTTKLSVHPNSFNEHLEYFRRHDFNVVPLKKAVEYIKEGKAPPRSIALTFDDGYYNNYQCAFPALMRHKMPATIFIIVEKVGKEGFMGWKELKELSSSGLVEIGSHTLSHPFLASLDDERLMSELSESRAILEKNLGVKVEALCYPYGNFDKRVEAMAKEAGYKFAVGTNPGKKYRKDDIFAIRRIKLSRTADNPVVLWFETSGYYTWVKEL